MGESLVTDVLALLETEADAILAGKYTVIDDLAARKADLFSALQRVPPPADDLRKISELLVRNQAMLAAAIRGISAARLRLEALRAVRDGLQVYDQSGRFAAMPVTRPDLVKKA